VDILFEFVFEDFSYHDKLPTSATNGKLKSSEVLAARENQLVGELPQGLNRLRK
jgi:hypothetical protein